MPATIDVLSHSRAIRALLRVSERVNSSIAPLE